MEEWLESMANRINKMVSKSLHFASLCFPCLVLEPTPLLAAEHNTLL